jgi:hypothetical protein
MMHTTTMGIHLEVLSVMQKLQAAKNEFFYMAKRDLQPNIAIFHTRKGRKKNG